MSANMMVRLQRLGNSVVLVLDPKLLEDHGVDPHAVYRLDLQEERITLERKHAETEAWTFDDAQTYVVNRYAQAFQVLAR